MYGTFFKLERATTWPGAELLSSHIKLSGIALLVRHSQHAPSPTGKHLGRFQTSLGCTGEEKPKQMAPCASVTSHVPPPAAPGLAAGGWAEPRPLLLTPVPNHLKMDAWPQRLARTVGRGTEGSWLQGQTGAARLWGLLLIKAGAYPPSHFLNVAVTAASLRISCSLRVEDCFQNTRPLQ